MIKKKEGLTAILASKESSDREILALINSFYGREIPFRTYNIVLLFINEIGITGLLFYAH